ncbi:tripartite tricarboxylate transporter substrate-binding protein [Polynucleobacter sp. IMCC 30228]|uniref:tripartite tricarboxylate transporter substrate-binding protein n=1 Tax=Polynucleobacter sp. IMCC 30228 TaxID=2781011 RepID=UPI001F3A2DD1|nr:tripartite tricarboxylate transporter substrate-binding protein [Polynucleobacter sp. IMCC 30228]MCE7527255.1 tripartite tricarboxylate transporter substrate binding protein BugD [Polynucleobacter sp. IMCC 30228]
MQITKKLVFAVSLASSIGLSALVVQAAEFPGDRPITLIVPFAAGGPTDKVARELALVMGKQLKGQIIVENTPGAGGTIAAKKVVNAPKDGHTLLIHHIGMSTAPALYKNLGFDPMNDYEYIGQVADVPMMLIANKDLPPKNFKDLVPYMKANTSKIAYANAGIGSASHLCGLLLMSRIQIDLTTVPYKGTAPALTDLMGNQVQLMCDQTTNIGTQVTAGSVKAYGTTTLQRIKAYDKVPTLNEEGLKNFEVKVWHGVYAPKGTPKADTEKLAAALKAAIQDPSYKSKMAEMGVEIPSQANASPEGLKNHLKAQIDLWSPIIKAAGVYAD